MLTWNQIQIETPPRKFIVELKRKFAEGDWLLSKKNPGHNHENLKNDIIWTFSWARFKEMSGQNCTSIRKSTSLTTRVKGFANLLPTLQELHIRRPDLYTSPNCILCKSKEKESINHLIECNMFIEDWKVAIDMGINAVWKVLEKPYSLELCPHDLKKLIFKESKEEQNYMLQDLVHGLVEKVAFDRVQSEISSPRVTANIFEGLIFILQECFYQYIWKRRCELVAGWEKAQGISSSRKRKRPEKNIDQENGFETARKSLPTRNSGHKKQASEKQAKEVKKLVREAVFSQISSSIPPTWWTKY